MSVRYKLYQNNNQESSTVGQWYGRAVPIGVVRIEQLAQDIEEKCTLTESDVRGVIIELTKQMRKHLVAGERVVLDGFGSFKCGIKTSGAPSPKAFTVTKNVKGVHVVFQPYATKSADGRYVKTILSGVTVEEMADYHVDKSEQEDGGDTDPQP